MILSSINNPNLWVSFLYAMTACSFGSHFMGVKLLFWGTTMMLPKGVFTLLWLLLFHQPLRRWWWLLLPCNCVVKGIILHPGNLWCRANALSYFVRERIITWSYISSATTEKHCLLTTCTNVWPILLIIDKGNIVLRVYYPKFTNKDNLSGFFQWRCTNWKMIRLGSEEYIGESNPVQCFLKTLYS